MHGYFDIYDNKHLLNQNLINFSLQRFDLNFDFDPDLKFNSDLGLDTDITSKHC